MSFLTVSEENVHKEGQGNFISTSGIYDVHMKGAEVAKTKNGATQINYYMDQCNSFGNSIFDKNGKKIFGYDILEALATVAGEDSLSNPEPTEIKFKSGVKELMCLPELTDIDVKAWVAFSYHLWNGEIKETIAIKRFYRASDNASGSECIDGKGAGTQYEKDMAYASTVKYDDGLTAEDIKEWKASKSKDSKNAGATQAKAAPKSAATAFPGQ